MASSSRIEDFPQENIEPVEGASEAINPTIVVASILRSVLESIPSTQGEPNQLCEPAEDVVASGHIQEAVMENAPIQREQEEENVPVDSHMVDAPIEGEQSIEKEATSQGEHTASVPIDDQFREGIVESASDDVNNDHVEPVARERRQISEEPTGPSGSQVVEEVETKVQDRAEAVKSRPPGLIEDVSGPLGSVVSEGEIPRVEEPAIAPEAPDPSPLATPAPPSPPSSSTAPLAPIPFKQPMPRTISSPTPFPFESSSSPTTSTSIPPPSPIIENPPASSSVGASSSSGPSSARPSIIPSPTHQSFPHPPTPPSFVTFIPEGAQLEGPFLKKFKDELEITTIRSVLEAPFIQKEVKLIWYFQLFNDYRYLHKLPEAHLGQFLGAVALLNVESPVNYSFKVDFATLQIPDSVFLPKLHSLVMDSSVGPVIFERFAHVMERISAQQGRLPSFHRFLFREFHLGHITSEVLAPLLSKSERLSPSEWEKHYNQSALQLATLNSSLFKAGKPTLSAEAFLDLNSINLVQEPYAQWVERYKLFVALKKDLLQHQIHYPIKINQFLRFARFGSFLSFKVSLGKDEYGTFIDVQRHLLIKRMLPDMGSSYSIAFGAFQAYFEEQECKALPIIQRHASLLSPAFYLPVTPQDK
ncbi:hypothetical protein Taro_003976 [Colocasia esculenta]|uniref:Uncharacterized protein n=1 Tax=Colocasia esculenta TaxID=4460 RepID=A0A843TIS2_COLES|nr:hypothetical protein [Colocasia esculenta]